MYVPQMISNVKMRRGGSEKFNRAFRLMINMSHFLVKIFTFQPKIKESVFTEDVIRTLQVKRNDILESKPNDINYTD